MRITQTMKVAEDKQVYRKIGVLLEDLGFVLLDVLVEILERVETKLGGN